MTAGTWRAGQVAGLAAMIVAFGGGPRHDARATGDTRTLSFNHTHRDDQLTVTFKRDGRYDQEALKKLNWFLRDWRTDEQTTMDPQLFDILWEVQRQVGSKESIKIISSYRSPATNAMLRRRSRGVARHSQHTQGRAIDFSIPGAPLEQLRIAGLRLQRGGVGFYPSSGSPFIHLDTGSVRHWPRMTREQLARVFPDGRTVHVPSDGQPLSGYALAQAKIEQRNSTAAVAQPTAAAPESSKRNLLASLFGFGASNNSNAPEEVATTASTATTRVAPQRPMAPEPKLAASRETAVPLPTARPVLVAAADPARRGSHAPVASLHAGMTPNDVIATRGYWFGLQGTPEAARREQRIA
ncbi:MAG: DUF882 domain-containing protein, partial [Proteobacteria bacterium]|nr:DUF882 domain-containing protein [Pseudomonadota bacterium]